MNIIKPIVEALFQLLVLLLFIWVNRKEINNSNKKYLIVFCVLFMLDTVVIQLLTIYSFNGWEWNWNWTGKTGSIVWALLFVYHTKLLSKENIGWTTKIKERKNVFVLLIAILFIHFLRMFFLHSAAKPIDVETFCFQATMPGIAEEIIYRGIFLGLLNKVFFPRFTLFNTKFGWGLILTAIAFGLIHGLSLALHFGSSFNFSCIPKFNAEKFIYASLFGFALGFIKEKSQSLLPSIILHNLWNIIVFWH